MASPELPLKARFANPSDEKLLLRWANDPEVRENSFSQSLISAETHKKWFRSRLQNIEQCKIFIIETEDQVPIGQVRFDLNERGWEIDYSIDRNFRGIGLGRRVLEIGLQTIQSENSQIPIWGKVLLLRVVDNDSYPAFFEWKGERYRLKIEKIV